MHRGEQSFCNSLCESRLPESRVARRTFSRHRWIFGHGDIFYRFSADYEMMQHEGRVRDSQSPAFLSGKAISVNDSAYMKQCIDSLQEYPSS